MKILVAFLVMLFIVFSFIKFIRSFDLSTYDVGKPKVQWEALCKIGTIALVDQRVSRIQSGTIFLFRGLREIVSKRSLQLKDKNGEKIFEANVSFTNLSIDHEYAIRDLHFFNSYRPELKPLVGRGFFNFYNFSAEPIPHLKDIVSCIRTHQSHIESMVGSSLGMVVDYISSEEKNWFFRNGDLVRDYIYVSSKFLRHVSVENDDLVLGEFSLIDDWLIDISKPLIRDNESNVHSDESLQSRNTVYKELGTYINRQGKTIIEYFTELNELSNRRTSEAKLYGDSEHTKKYKKNTTTIILAYCDVGTVALTSIEASFYRDQDRPEKYLQFRNNQGELVINTSISADSPDIEFERGIWDVHFLSPARPLRWNPKLMALNSFTQVQSYLNLKSFTKKPVPHLAEISLCLQTHKSLIEDAIGLPLGILGSYTSSRNYFYENGDMSSEYISMDTDGSLNYSKMRFNSLGHFELIDHWLPDVSKPFVYREESEHFRSEERKTVETIIKNIDTYINREGIKFIDYYTELFELLKKRDEEYSTNVLNNQ
jgi:hypothetical protein